MNKQDSFLTTEDRIDKVLDSFERDWSCDEQYLKEIATSSGFERDATPALADFVMTTEYAADIDTPCAFPPQKLVNSMGEYLASLGKTQLRIAETEKYAHVTFFFNGGREDEFAGEERVLVPSPKVATYDLQPEMSAPEVTDKLVAAIDGGRFDLIVVNYANGDMVGHTGDLQAAMKAAETVDHCIGRVSEAVERAGGSLLITADHGNAEQMLDPTTGQPHTAHTMNKVPLILVNAPDSVQTLADGRLADIAPTVLALMALPQPAAMTGECLIRPIPEQLDRAAVAAPATVTAG